MLLKILNGGTNINPKKTKIIIIIIIIIIISDHFLLILGIGLMFDFQI